ncbi:hypothetical protein MVEN_01538400 [Mycena venus]|uniref:MARVEL domain-containing protein n=1 Tax=Mycena venus TaxID=2733690 RepID=A0A8H6XWQ9_9AGAR|nr:hypothetical protein MVEN_01538400 [Mycena venus]
MRPRRFRTKSTQARRLFRPNFPSSNFAGMSFVEAHYHPFLFTMMTLTGIAEAGLTTFLVNAGNAHDTWPSPRYHSFLLFILFNAIWTVVFCVAYMLWLVDGSEALPGEHRQFDILAHCYHSFMGCFCRHLSCHENRGKLPYLADNIKSLTVEALAWAEFGLSTVALFWTCVWVGSSGRKRVRDSVRDSRRMV